LLRELAKFHGNFLVSTRILGNAISSISFQKLVQRGGNKQTIKSHEKLIARKAEKWCVYLRHTVLVDKIHFIVTSHKCLMSGLYSMQLRTAINK
jgi:hypothetical protein